MNLCVDTPFPTLQSIMDKLPLPFEGFNIPNIAGLIGLPVPLFMGMTFPTFEIPNVALALQQAQLTLGLTTIAEALSAIAGGSISAFLPSLPGLSLDPLAALQGGQALYDAVRQAIIAEGVAIFSYVIPTPIFPGLESLNFSTMAVFKAIRTYLMTGLVTMIQSLVSPVLSILQLGGSLTLPTIPSIAEIKALILSQIGDISLSIELPTLPSITIPGFPSITIPNILPGVISPSIILTEAFNVVYSELVAALLDKIYQFIQSTLGVLGITLPLLCIPI